MSTDTNCRNKGIWNKVVVGRILIQNKYFQL